jgi:general secretion pathway protein H
MPQASGHTGTRAGSGGWSSRGLTLVELLVVLALLGLAATSVALKLGPTTRAARLRSATLQIEQLLRLARHQAVATHQRVDVQFECGGQRFRVVDGRQVGPWHVLDGVTVSGARLAERAMQPGLLAVPVVPGGVVVPFALELQAGAALRVVWNTALPGRLQFQDDVKLAAWRPPSGLERP